MSELDMADETTTHDETHETPGDAPPPEPPDPRITLTIDGLERKVDPGGLVLDACNDNGAYVPHFCYHPRMSPTGRSSTRRRRP